VRECLVEECFIALVNQYLRQTSDAKLSGRGVTDAQWYFDIQIYRAEARALRALAYYHLMDLWKNSICY
jgi:hypothetical protein